MNKITEGKYNNGYAKRCLRKSTESPKRLVGMAGDGIDRSRAGCGSSSISCLKVVGRRRLQVLIRKSEKWLGVMLPYVTLLLAWKIVGGRAINIFT